MTEFAQLLQEYGGWGVAVILGLAFYKFYNDTKDEEREHAETLSVKDEQILKMTQDHHEEMIAVVRECTGVLATVHESLNRWEQKQHGRRAEDG